MFGSTAVKKSTFSKPWIPVIVKSHTGYDINPSMTGRMDFSPPTMPQKHIDEPESWSNSTYLKKILFIESVVSQFGPVTTNSPTNSLQISQGLYDFNVAKLANSTSSVGNYRVSIHEYRKHDFSDKTIRILEITNTHNQRDSVLLILESFKDSYGKYTGNFDISFLSFENLQGFDYTEYPSFHAKVSKDGNNFEVNSYSTRVQKLLAESGKAFSLAQIRRDFKETLEAIENETKASTKESTKTSTTLEEKKKDKGSSR